MSEDSIRALQQAAGSRTVVRPIVMHRIDDDTVAVLTIGGIGIGETIPYDKFQTFVLRRSDGPIGASHSRTRR